MTTPIIIEVTGDPKPQPRARSFVLRGRGGKPIMNRDGQPIIRVHEAGTAEFWKGQIADVAKPFVPMPPLHGPVRVDIEFRFRRPKCHFRSNGELKPLSPLWCDAKRNDVDNLFKAVTDCLTVLGMWEDDGQIVSTKITKRYTVGAEYDRPGATISIEPLSDQAPHVQPKREATLSIGI